MGDVFSQIMVSCTTLALVFSLLACVASVPERRERNSGRAKEFFAFAPREKWGESKKVEGARVRKISFARSEFRLHGTGTLATQAIPLLKCHLRSSLSPKREIAIDNLL